MDQQREFKYVSQSPVVDSAKLDLNLSHLISATTPDYLRLQSEKLKLIALDHAYLRHSSNFKENKQEPVHDEEDAKEDKNPVRVIKEQFILRTIPIQRNLDISSFDVAVAYIEELNHDGSHVDKWHSFNPCNCHDWYDDQCTMCEFKPFTKPSKVNRKPQIKRKADESLSENTENSDEEYIKMLIHELMADKKRSIELKCQVCKKIFTQRSSLKSHYKSHLKIKDITCALCPKFFTRKSGLKYHMSCHNNEFRFTCNECGKKYRHISHFKEHCKSHTLPKLKCTQCSSAFKNRNTLKRHMKTKHGEVLMAVENVPSINT